MLVVDLIAESRNGTEACLLGKSCRRIIPIHPQDQTAEYELEEMYPSPIISSAAKLDLAFCFMQG